jgi:outer membrane protein TolC
MRNLLQTRSWRTVSAVPLTAVAIAFALGGCRSPRAYRENADRVAYRILARQQQKLFGKPSDFEVRSPAEQLRRRLLHDQALPTAFAASAGIESLVPNPRLPDTGYLQRAADPSLPPWLSGEITAAAPMIISLSDALQIAARNSREYQDEKERVFITALGLDLERDAFRNTWQGLLSGEIESDLTGEDTVSWSDRAASLELSRLFKGGAAITAQLGINLVRLLTGTEDSSLGVFGDASISIPLLRGSSRFVVTEPMTQAERNVVYALYDFERFKRTFAVRIASEYLSVLEQGDRVQNAEENYRGLAASARRARRLADMGRLPEIQVDQAIQDELRARDRWIAAVQQLQRSQDSFKLLLGLPVDAAVAPDPDELAKLAELNDHLAGAQGQQPQHTQAATADSPSQLDYPTREGGGRFEMDPQIAIQLAFDHRLDLRVAIGRIDDAQRGVAIAADALRADLTLLGAVSVGERRGAGSADEPNAELRFDRGVYSGLLTIDLPFERTAERNRYRLNWIELEQAVRAAQKLEDQIKFDVRDQLRVLLEAREAVQIQLRAVEVARRRVRGTELFLQQGRAEIRDVLEARESLISAENALTSGIVRYRVAELEFQRDLGVLEVAANGLWTEFVPENSEVTNED